MIKGEQAIGRSLSNGRLICNYQEYGRLLQPLSYPRTEFFAENTGPCHLQREQEIDGQGK